MSLLSGTITIEDSNFTGNAARDGGALLARGGAVVTVLGRSLIGIELLTLVTPLGWLAAATALPLKVASSIVLGSRFRSNEASRAGGAVLASAATVTLADKTRMEENTAPRGATVELASGAQVLYALPVPLGHWLPSVVRCEAGFLLWRLPYARVCASGYCTTPSGGGFDHNGS